MEGSPHLWTRHQDPLNLCKHDLKGTFCRYRLRLWDRSRASLHLNLDQGQLEVGKGDSHCSQLCLQGFQKAVQPLSSQAGQQ